MGLDIGSAIAGVASVALCAVPFVLMMTNRKKKEKQFIQSLHGLAKQQQHSISKYEIVRNFIIGIDETRKVLYYLKKKDERTIEKQIDLNNFHHCEVIKTTRTVKQASGSQTIIDKIELQFSPKAKGRPIISIEFFNTDETIQLYGELIAANQWCDKLNLLLTKLN